MPRPDCAAGNCLPGADSVWFLVALGVVWATASVLFAALAVRSWREQRPGPRIVSNAHRARHSSQP